MSKDNSSSSFSFIDDIKHSLTSRIKHPLISSFLISWLFFNWRSVFIAISTKPVEDKIALIENYLGWWNSLGIPLALALFYVLGLPYISNLIEKVIWKAKEEKIDATYKVRDKHIRKETALASANFKLEEARSGKRELENLREQIEQLSATNEKKDKTILELRNLNEEVKNDLNNIILNENKDANLIKLNENSNLKILDFIDRLKTVSKENLYKNFSSRQIKKLESNNLIQVVDNRPNYYKLTPEAKNLIRFLE